MAHVSRCPDSLEELKGPAKGHHPRFWARSLGPTVHVKRLEEQPVAPITHRFHGSTFDRRAKDHETVLVIGVTRAV